MPPKQSSNNFSSSVPESSFWSRVRATIILAVLVFCFTCVSGAYAVVLDGSALESPANLVNNVTTVSTGVGQVQPRSNSFIGNLLKNASENRSRMVWGFYPASIRGRIFSGSTEINDPFDRTSTNHGGGW